MSSHEERLKEIRTREAFADARNRDKVLGQQQEKYDDRQFQNAQKQADRESNEREKNNQRQFIRDENERKAEQKIKSDELSRKAKLEAETIKGQNSIKLEQLKIDDRQQANVDEITLNKGLTDNLDWIEGRRSLRDQIDYSQKVTADMSTSELDHDHRMTERTHETNESIRQMVLSLMIEQKFGTHAQDHHERAKDLKTHETNEAIRFLKQQMENGAISPEDLLSLANQMQRSESLQDQSQPTTDSQIAPPRNSKTTS